ncbi:MAG: ABC transporter permease, partial [bacterium]
MLGNYLKIAVRTLLRNRIYTAINVLGLAIAVAACLLIVTYLHFELTWDSSFHDADRVYRVLTLDIPKGRDAQYNTNVTSLLAPELENDVPGIASVCRIMDNETLVRIDRDLVTISSMSADSSVANVFGLTMLEGDPGTALTGLRSILISKSFAEKYFHEKNLIGQPLEIAVDTFEVFSITGIFQDFPVNTTYRPDLIYPYEVDYTEIHKRLRDTWGTRWSNTFVRLEPDTDPASVEAAIAALIESLHANDNEEYLYAWHLQPVRQMHLAIRNPRGMPTTTEASGATILLGITLIILLIAGINFTTLSLGRSTTRTKEVGMRKVLGANRAPLMTQFWVETGVLAFIAVMIGVLFAELSLPVFNNLADRELALRLTPTLLVSMVAVWGIIVFLAGSYPALVIAAFRPAQAFKGEVKVGGRSLLRRTLVFVQFSLSISLIALTLIMYRQLHFVSQKKLGFNGDQVVMISAFSMEDTGKELMLKLREQLRDNPDVLSISGAANAMSSPWFEIGWTDLDGRDWSGLKLNIVDPEWLNTLEIPILSGRNLDALSGHDSLHAVLLNQKAAELFSFDDPVGKRLPGNFDEIAVVGVIPDLHMASLHEEIAP